MSESLPPKRHLAMMRRLLRRLLGVAGDPAEGGTNPAPNARNLPALEGRLEILRDRHGVPHLYGERERDVFVALGFLQAADRFAFLDLIRHLGAGRYCQLLGNFKAPESLDLVGGKEVRDVDRFIRPLDFEAQCQADYERASDRVRRCLEGFADGVNAALRAMGGVYPDEYVFFGRVEPWRPWDALLNGRTCAFVVSLTGIEHELILDAVRGHVGDAVARQIYPDLPWDDAPKSYVPEDGPPLELGIHDIGGGSNNWAVNGSRAAGGAPIVANDPHVPLIPLPTFWYHAHLDYPGVKVQGGQFPGCPVFGLGHNGALAWGVTTGFRDGWDLVRVHRLRDDPMRYRTVDGTGAIERHKEEVYARFGRSVSLDWESCEHGILYPGWRHHDGVDLAVRFVSADMAEYFSGSLDLMAAQTVDEHRAALARLNEGPFDFNHVYAHRDGHIAWEVYGRLPNRPKDGAFPRDAHDPDAQWRGFLAFEDMPKIQSPSNGFVVSANSVTDPENFESIATRSNFEPRYRQDRIEQLLASRDRHDVSSFRDIQADAQPVWGEELRDVFVAALSRSEKVATDLAEPLAALRAWDCRFSATSAGATLFIVSLERLQSLCFVPLLGDAIGAAYVAGRKCRARLQQLLLDADDPLRRSIEGAAGRTVDELIAESFAAAVAQLGKKLGRNPTEWGWGKLHRAWLGTTLGVLPGIGRFFVALDQPQEGDSYTVNASKPVPAGDRLISLVSPTTRFICDLSKPDEAWFTHSSGPSGDPRSPYFANTSQDWLEIKHFRSCLWSADEVPDVTERYQLDGGKPGSAR